MKSLDKDKFALVLDVGTTGIKAFVFNKNLAVLTKSYRDIPEILLHPGHVEQDPAEIIRLAREVLLECVQTSKVSTDAFVGLGITNQRETVVAWDKKTAWPFYPAIVWKDTRTQEKCAVLSQAHGEAVRAKTGLRILPYFSASKMSWLLEKIPEVRTAAENGCLGLGTVDTWLLWNLTEEKSYLTDQTNAARTLLFNLQEKKWDLDLLKIFDLPSMLLPAAQATKSNFGTLKKEILGFSLPILAVCGDQQASLYAAGQTSGTTKITYGTGTFIMQIIGAEFSLREKYFTTLTADGKNFAVEAKVDHGAKDIDKILQDKEKLTACLKDIAVDVDEYIKTLPVKPQEIIIDGGVMRDGIVGKFQEEISGIKIREQSIFDGTALGTAKLVFGFV